MMCCGELLTLMPYRNWRLPGVWALGCAKCNEPFGEALYIIKGLRVVRE